MNRRKNIKNISIVFLMVIFLFILFLQSNYSYGVENISINDTGRYTLSMESVNRKDPIPIFADNESEGIIKVNLDVSGTTVDYQKAYIRFSVPKTSMVSLTFSDFEGKQGSGVRRPENNIYNYDVVFKNLRGGDKLSFYVRAKFIEGFTPNNKIVPIKAELYTPSNEKLAESNVVKIQSKINLPELIKTTDNKVPAGTVIDGYFSKTKPVKYTFNIRAAGFKFNALRNIDTFTIKDELPTYVARDGSTKTAKISDISKGDWVLSEDGRYATYRNPKDWFTRYYSNYFFDTVSLYLEFPDAKLNSSITNKATATLIPYNKQEDEEDFVISSTSKTTLIEYVVKPIVGTVSKLAKEKIVEDVIESKTKPQSWEISVYTKDSSKVKNMELIETPDENLYVDSIYDPKYNDKKTVAKITKIEGTTLDGNTENVSYTTQRGSFFNPEYILKINNPTKYKSLRIIFDRNYEHDSYAFNSAEIGIRTKFRDPSAVLAKKNPQGFNNTVRWIADSIDESRSLDASSTSNFKLSALESKFSLKVVKDYENTNTVLTSGKEVRLEITPGNNVPTNGSITGRKIVVILPHEMDKYNNGGVDFDLSFRGIKYTLDNDYNKTGRRAIIYTLPNLRETDLNTFSDKSKIYLDLKGNKYLNGEPVIVEAYYSFDGIDDSMLVNDIFSSPGNGKSEVVDNIYKIGNHKKVGMGYVKWNSLPTTELGATSLVARSDESDKFLTPYSIDIEKDNTFIMGIRVRNNQEKIQSGLVLYDVLPHKNDKNIIVNSNNMYKSRGSNSDVVLTEEITPPIGYTVKYLSTEPRENVYEAISDPNWTTTAPKDLSTVKAIALFANDGVVLKQGNSILLKYKVMAKNLASIPDIVNSFAYRTTERPLFVESNGVHATLPISLTLEKKWLTASGEKEVSQLTNEKITIPDSINIEIFANGNKYKTVELNKSNNWTLDINDLPRYDGGNLINYSFRESPIDGWTAEDPTSDEKKIIFKNKYNVKRKNITVNKEWNDSGKNVRHPEVTVHLHKKNSTDNIAEIKLNEENKWTGNFTNIPIEDGEANDIEYTVSEEKIDSFLPEVSGNVNDGFTITNTYQIPDVTVTFIFDNGKEDVVETIKQDEKVIEPTNPTKENYNFKGWYLVEENTVSNKVYNFDTPVIKDIILKAVWEEKPKVEDDKDKDKDKENKVPDDRTSGKDRIETSIEISKKHFSKSRYVIIARSDLFPDSLTATVLASQLDAPILLTSTHKLYERVIEELKRLDAKEIIIVGGVNSISEIVRKELEPYDIGHDVERLHGEDRYGTSEMVAKRIAGLTNIKNTAIFASGEVFPDALSISPYASRERHPILLVTKNSIPSQVKRAIEDLSISKSYIVGGENTIGKEVSNNLPQTVERFAGIDRYETAIIIAKEKYSSAKKTFVASGEKFSDALVVGPAAYKQNLPILLSPGSKVNESLRSYIHGSDIESLEIVGGEMTLNTNVKDKLNESIKRK